MTARLWCLVTAVLACGLMREDCPSSLTVAGDPPPGWQEVVSAAEERCGPVTGTLHFFRDTPCPCGDLAPDQASGCSYASTCGIDLGVRWGEGQPTAEDTALAHELCHEACGVWDEGAANDCAAEVNALSRTRGR